LCSTPFGIRERFTRESGRYRQYGFAGAQRLSASEKGSPCGPTRSPAGLASAQRLSASEKGSRQRGGHGGGGQPVLVLNAFRHQRKVHSVPGSR